MLAYAEYGKGPPVIFLHGLLGSKANMTGVARSLADRYHSFVVELRNHGESFHHSSMTYGTMAADLGGFMDDHDIDTASIVGHSMGGKCAMQFALSFPERVEKLVVVDIAPKRYRDPAWVGYLQSMQSLDLENLGTRKDADLLLRASISDPVYRHFLLSNLVKREDGTYHWKPNLEAISSALEHISATVTGSGCDVATLFIKGELSDYIKDEDTELINQLFPQAEIVSIPDAGHLVHIEARDRFRQLLSDFLQKENKNG